MRSAPWQQLSSSAACTSPRQLLGDMRSAHTLAAAQLFSSMHLGSDWATCDLRPYATFSLPSASSVSDIALRAKHAAAASASASASALWHLQLQRSASASASASALWHLQLQRSALASASASALRQLQPFSERLAAATASASASASALRQLQPFSEHLAAASASASTFYRAPCGSVQLQ